MASKAAEGLNHPSSPPVQWQLRQALPNPALPETASTPTLHTLCPAHTPEQWQVIIWLGFLLQPTLSLPPHILTRPQSPYTHLDNSCRGQGTAEAHDHAANTSQHADNTQRCAYKAEGGTEVKGMGA